jgi:NAD(P)H-dependent FMN reductase
MEAATMSDAVNIPVLLGSVRRNRRSAMVGRWLHRQLEMDDRITTHLIDLEELVLPIMEERLRMREDPPPGAVTLSEVIAAGDGLVIVTPEYNHGYPGVLKNALDYILPELKRKPVGIVTVSAGGFGGINCLAQLRLVLLAMGAAPIPASLPVSRVTTSFTDEGPADDGFADRARNFIDEVVWWTSAAAAKKKQEPLPPP